MGDTICTLLPDDAQPTFGGAARPSHPHPVPQGRGRGIGGARMRGLVPGRAAYECQSCGRRSDGRTTT